MKIFAFLLLPALALADEGAEMGRRVQELLRAHQADVFGCVAAQQKDADGELLLRVFVGEEAKAGRVDVLKDGTGHVPLGKCLVAAVRGWDLSSLHAESGDQLVFPLAFHSENPYRVHAEPQKGDAKVQPTVLWSGGKASLTLLKLAQSVRLAAHVHPSAEAVYVVKGMLRVRQNGKQESLKAGDAAFFAANEPHSLEAAPLAPVELLQIFTPAGPELAYHDHKAGGTTASTKSAEKPAVIAMGTKALPIKGGSIKLFLDGSGAPLALDELSAEAGTQIPLHKHEGSDELLYVLEGKTTATISGKTFVVIAGDSLRIPAGSEHSVVVDEKLTAVQIYAPGGPEQRFKK